MLKLPIDRHLPEVLKELEKSPSLILKASPGSGKTTRVPPLLLNLSSLKPGFQIFVLEPRRLAAKYAALRVAEELKAEVGGLVGYHFRFEKKVSSETRILFLTEGMLVRYLLQDPLLSRTAIVILDEFHERHLQTDLALGLVKNLQRTRRPDLKIVVMSATLDTEALKKYLGDTTSLIEVEAPAHPVENIFLSEIAPKPLEAQVVQSLGFQIEAKPEGGHILVFLPGMAEIRRTETALSALSHRYGLKVFPLHGELNRNLQEQALGPSRQRKVILSTNVAESSLTIDGVDCVIDSGLERTLSYSVWSGIPSLLTKKISRASAIQRAGRAGRTGPGVCRRLYTQHEFSTWPSFQTAEVLRADLAQSFLELMKLGWNQITDFPWFEPPPATSLQNALALLQKLGAFTTELTSLGKEMARFPTHPRISRMLLEAQRQGCTEGVARLSAYLSEGQLQTLDATESLRSAPSFTVKRTEETLMRLCDNTGEKNPLKLSYCVLTGFPDRVARRRESRGKTRSQEVEIVLADGGHAFIAENSFSLENEFFIILDLQEKRAFNKSQIYVRAACAISEVELLELTPSLIEETTLVFWDKEKERVFSSYQLRYGLLVLEEKALPLSSSPEAFRLFLKEGMKLQPEDSLELWAQALERFCAKEVLQSQFARLKLYADKTGKEFFTPARFAQALCRHLGNDFSLTKMRGIDWESFIAEAFLEESAFELNRLLPAFLQLTPQRKARIYYATNQNPWVESRIQDFFGMKTGPTILGGKLPLTLHLLAPNQRAVQVTNDLAGFWVRSYPQIRQELMRRYPRHKWPENPLKVENPKL